MDHTYPQKLRLNQTDSTNAEMRRLAAKGMAPHGMMVSAVEQTAGRGQRGNSWEAQPGANVTMSLMLRPARLEARRQFLLSVAVSLGVTEALGRFVEPRRVNVKWPNDIYIDDRKVCGILIENTLSGPSVAASIVGVGLNVNQTRFLSDAPNPVSLAMVTGKNYSVEEVEECLARAILSEVEALDRALGGGGDIATMHTRYMSKLWRRTGTHPFIDAATGEDFMARIHDVAEDGVLTLIDTCGDTRQYLFKEVAYRL